MSGSGPSNPLRTVAAIFLHETPYPGKTSSRFRTKIPAASYPTAARSVSRSRPSTSSRLSVPSSSCAIFTRSRFRASPVIPRPGRTPPLAAESISGDYQGQVLIFVF